MEGPDIGFTTIIGGEGQWARAAVYWIVMAEKPRVVPRFSSEAEEAEWWNRNRDMISRDLKAAAKAGDLKVLTGERLRERLQARPNSWNG
jgi:hypothetical protein